MEYIGISSLDEFKNSPINLTGVRVVNCSDEHELDVLLNELYVDLGSIVKMAGIFGLGSGNRISDIRLHLFDRRASCPCLILFYDYSEEQAFILEYNNSADFSKLNKFINSIIFKPMPNELSKSCIKSKESEINSFRCYDKLNY